MDELARASEAGAEQIRKLEQDLEDARQKASLCLIACLPIAWLIKMYLLRPYMC